MINLPPDLARQGETFLRHQFLNNQFLIAGAMGAATWGLRSIPRKIWNFLLRWLTVEVTINSDQNHYDNINRFVLNHVIIRRFQRDFVINTTRKGQAASIFYPEDEKDDDKVSAKASLTPGYSRHLGWYDRRLVHITRGLIENTTGDTFKEQLHLRFFGIARRRVTKFLREANEFVNNTEEQGVEIKYHGSDYWWSLGNLPPRDFSSIFIDPHTIERVKTFIDRFENDGPRRAKRGQPWRTGVFLSGQPGCGKTSMVHAIASYMNRGICYLNLSSITSDNGLISLVCGDGIDWSKNLLVIEDIDASSRAVKKRNENNKDEKDVLGVSLSSLLNALDGVLTPPGLFVVATSNHPEVIDPALIRRGRFDLKLDLGLMQWPEFIRMAEAFEVDPESVFEAGKFQPIAPVEAMHHLEERSV